MFADCPVDFSKRATRERRQAGRPDLFAPDRAGEVRIVTRVLIALVLLALASGCDQAECLAHCNDHYQQVCGDDERTYLNPCRANCSGTTVDYAGPCQGDEPERES